MSGALDGHRSRQRYPCRGDIQLHDAAPRVQQLQDALWKTSRLSLRGGGDGARAQCRASINWKPVRQAAAATQLSGARRKGEFFLAR